MSNQCGHGHLRRVCEICQRDEEIEQLKAERDALKAAAEKGTEYVLAQINQDLRAERDALLADAERYRWLRDTLHGAKAGGGLTVNDELQVYEAPIPGEEVRIYWYPDTPAGHYEQLASTLDAAIDAARGET